MTHPAFPVGQIVQPIDILSGLGAADKPLLSACVALFEDSTLARRLSQLYGQVKGSAPAWLRQAWGVREIENVAASVKSRIVFRRDGDCSKDDLRLIAWIYLREAFALPERLCLSERGAGRICDDLAAAAIAVGAPLSATPAATPDDPNQGAVNLAWVVQPVLQELLATALGEGPGQLDAAAQKRLVAEARAGLERMDEADRERLLKAAAVQDLNDAAVRNILLTGGGLVAFGGGVKVAGFSAYILAAQASAFIPLVSGPGLVSIVSVLSNPITVVVMSALALWWFAREADRQVRAAVGLRVLSLLAAHGLSAGRSDVLRALASFRRIEQLQPFGELSDDVCRRYREDWRALQEAERHLAERKRAIPKTEPLHPRILEWLERPAVEAAGPLGRLAQVLFPGVREEANAAVISVLTLGDIVYSAAMIDPSVIEAADFSYSEAIDNLVAFSDLTSKILELSPIQASGAINRLEGYVAEQVVAAELVAQGHQVVFPGTSNQEGWDLLVDGQEFQVKCLQGLGGLTEHFSKFEYPVLANAELAEAIAGRTPEWAHKVFFVEGYSHDLISQITPDSLAAGSALVNPNVPVFAICVGAANNVWAYVQGQITGAQAMHQIMLDGTTRVGLIVAGGFVGKTVGLLVFGPAGALVLGTALPVLCQAQAKRVIDNVAPYVLPGYEHWEKETNASVDTLVRRLEAALEAKTAILRTKYRSLGCGVLGRYVKTRIEYDARFLRESTVRLERAVATPDRPEGRALAVIARAASSTVHPALFQTEMKALFEVLVRRPSITAPIGGWATTVWHAIVRGISATGSVLSLASGTPQDRRGN